MQDDFYLDGVSARSKGIRLQAPIEISVLTPKIQTYSIPGRNGDLHLSEGAYENRTATMRCFVLTKNAETTMQELNDFLFQDKVRQLKIQPYADMYWEAVCTSANDLNIRAGILNPFTVTFTLNPEKKQGGEETQVYDEGESGGGGSGGDSGNDNKSSYIVGKLEFLGNITKCITGNLENVEA